MKLTKIFSILGLLAVVTACGSSQPTTAAYPNGYNPYGTTVYPQNGNYNYYGGGTIFPYSSYAFPGTTFSVSANVNAGDRINVNLSMLTYQVGQATCDGVIDTTLTGFGGTHQVTSATVTLNGQNITGSTQAPAAGVLTISGTLAPISINCSFLYGNRSATINSYVVSVANAVTH